MDVKVRALSKIICNHKTSLEILYICFCKILWLFFYGIICLRFPPLTSKDFIHKLFQIYCVVSLPEIGSLECCRRTSKSVLQDIRNDLYRAVSPGSRRTSTLGRLSLCIIYLELVNCKIISVLTITYKYMILL